MSFGLSETALEAIRSVLARHPAVEEAVVFGSRALGRENPRSDVDIALRGQLPALEAEGIALELEELPIPVRFDVQSLESIHHDALRESVKYCIREERNLGRRNSIDPENCDRGNLSS